MLGAILNSANREENNLGEKGSLPTGVLTFYLLLPLTEVLPYNVNVIKDVDYSVDVVEDVNYSVDVVEEVDCSVDAVEWCKCCRRC